MRRQGSDACSANMVLGAVAICKLITRGPEITVCSSASCPHERREKERAMRKERRGVRMGKGTDDELPDLASEGRTERID